jgi:hypothetical protein
MPLGFLDLVVLDLLRRMQRLSQRTLRQINHLGMRRSASDSSGIKEKSMNSSSNMVEHEHPSSNKTKNNTRKPLPTPSEVESPIEDDDFEAESDNDSHDARTEKDLLSKKRNAKDSRKKQGRQKKKRTSSSSVKSPIRSSTRRKQSRHLDSTSDERNEVDSPDEESPRPSTGSALKKVNTKTLTLTPKTQQLVNLLEIHVIVTHFMKFLFKHLCFPINLSPRTPVRNPQEQCSTPIPEKLSMSYNYQVSHFSISTDRTEVPIFRNHIICQ